MHPSAADFRHYGLKQRAISWVSRNLFDHCTYTVRHGLLRGMKRQGGLGWIPESLIGKTLTREHQFWRDLNLAGLTVYDVGAFEGLLTLWFARSARQVICYEPNSRNRSRLIENVHLNGLQNVLVRDVGLGETPRELEMVWDVSMPGGASVDPSVVRALQQTTPTAKTQAAVITTLDLDRAALNLPAPDVIKIDIEGCELEALVGARGTLAAHRPALYIEMHGETMREKRRKADAIVAFLREMRYASIQHVETGQIVTPENSAAACRGHLFAVAVAGQAMRAAAG